MVLAFTSHLSAVSSQESGVMSHESGVTILQSQNRDSNHHLAFASTDHFQIVTFSNH